MTSHVHAPALLRVRSLPPRGGREGPLRERPTGPPHAQGGGDVARARRAARTVGHEGGAAEDRLAGPVRGGEQPRPEHLDAAARAGRRRGGGSLIETVPRRGYRFVGPVEEQSGRLAEEA